MLLLIILLDFLLGRLVFLIDLKVIGDISLNHLKEREVILNIESFERQGR